MTVASGCRRASGYEKLTLLRSGELTLALDGADPRYIAFEAEEVVRSIYAPVHNLDLGTLPSAARTRRCDASGEAFTVRIELESPEHEIAVDLTLEARGDENAFEYAMPASGVGSPAFAKIWLNIHRPDRGTGATYLAGDLDWRVNPVANRGRRPAFSRRRTYSHPVRTGCQESEVVWGGC